MITLTESAAKQIKTMAEEVQSEEKTLRILVESGGCSGFEYGMGFDAEKEGDSVTEAHGMKIVIDPTSLTYLKGATVDFDDGLNGKGFEIINPNAESSCGCGKSFS